MIVWCATDRKVLRYYKRVRADRTTISCRVFPPLGLLFVVASAALIAAPRVPLALSWRTPLGSQPAAPAAADQTHVFVPLRDGRLAAIGREAGAERWSIRTGSTLSPAVGDGFLFVAESAGLAALRVPGGQAAWRLPLGPIAVPPAWRTGWVFAAQEDGELLALRATDGVVVWRRALGRLAAAPTIAGERLFAPVADGRLVALNVTDGREVWSRRLGGAPGAILVDGNRLFAGSRDNFFYCFDADDGEYRWRWRTGGDVTAGARSDGARVYFLSLDNVLRALDRDTGVQRWRKALPMRPFDALDLVDGRLVVSGLSPEIVMFEARDGAPAGRVTAPADLSVPAIVFEDGSTRLVAIVGALTGEWMAVGFGVGGDPPLVPLTELPGRPVALGAPPAPPGSSPRAGGHRPRSDRATAPRTTAGACCARSRRRRTRNRLRKSRRAGRRDPPCARCRSRRAASPRGRTRRAAPAR
jgi:outer membrane protein assembly factor BamB